MGAEEPRTNVGGAMPFCILGPTQSLKSVAHPGPAPLCPAYLSRCAPSAPASRWSVWNQDSLQGYFCLSHPCDEDSQYATKALALPPCPRHRGDA